MKMQTLTQGLLSILLLTTLPDAVIGETMPAKLGQRRQVVKVDHLPIPNLNNLIYHEARKKLIDAGWQPRMISPMHREGYVESGNGSIFLEKGYWEVVSCSGTGLGYCGFEFTDVYGNYLYVVTAGQEIPEEGIYAGVADWRLHDLPYEQRH